MKIDELIEQLIELKDSGIEDVFIERASMLENVANEFRGGYIWLVGMIAIKIFHKQ